MFQLFLGFKTTLDPIDFHCMEQTTETFLKISSFVFHRIIHFWVNYPFKDAIEFTVDQIFAAKTNHFNRNPCNWKILFPAQILQKSIMRIRHAEQ